MATTEDRLTGTEELEKLYKSPAAPSEAPAEAEHPSEPRGAVVSARDARRLLIAWAAVIGVIMVFEPTPDNANPVVPMWAELAAVGFLSALFATAMGFGTRRHWAPRASLVAAGFGAVLAIACAATDHHTGSWWAYELVAFGGLAAMTMAAARRAS
jgi:peptidoglycan/LPS O-acetylase OafA/YrhL